MMRRLILLGLVLISLLPSMPARAASHTLRAFWVDAFHAGIKTPAQTSQLIADAERAGANALMIQIRRRGDSYYRDSAEPLATDVAANYDPLSDVIAKAHAKGWQVHGWVVTLPIWRDGYDQPNRDHVWYRHGAQATGRANWLMQRDDGKAGDCASPTDCTYFLDPGHPEAADYTLYVLLHLAQRYDLDGLHLDYIRYPSARFGYNPTSLARFQAEAGRRDVPSAEDPQWLQWRRDQVTKLVKRIYLNLLAHKPHMQLSSAVITWGDGPTNGDWTTSAAYKRVLQDWSGWLKSGYLDWVVIMNYQAESKPDQRDWYRNWVDWVRQQHGDGRVAIGLGAWLNSADENLAQLRYATAGSGLRGTALYSYAVPATTERGAFLDRLRAELWNEAVSAPVPPSKTQPQTGFVLGRLALDGTARSNTTLRLTSPGLAPIVTTTDGSGVFGAVGVQPGSWTVQSEWNAQTITVVAGKVTHVTLNASTTSGPVPTAADPAFGALWNRTDRAVAQGQVQRSWLWGPASYSTAREPYAESPQGQRTVQYWDKSRMEVTQPELDRSSLWFVTNGLLVRELVSGQMQTGDQQATPRSAAEVPIGGNANDTTLGPTYADFAQLASLNNDRRSPDASGQTVIQTISAMGSVGSDQALSRYGVRQADYNTTLGHNIPDVFSRYLGQLPLDWVFVMGYPISEPYWARYQVGDQVQDVLVQLYERRTLTYTPANPAAFRVEMGNVGQHYFRWRYNAAPWE